MTEHCRIVNEKCNKHHCHLCNQDTDYPCICSDCATGIGQSWTLHYWNHLQTKEYDRENCRFCQLELESMEQI